MAVKQEIEIYITEGGEVTFHIKGIKGPVCEKIARGFAGPLGELKTFTRTPEYYQNDSASGQITSAT